MYHSAKAVLGAFGNAPRRGVKNAGHHSLSFAEEGGDSATMQEKPFMELAKRTGMRISGSQWPKGILQPGPARRRHLQPTVDVKPDAPQLSFATKSRIAFVGAKRRDRLAIYHRARALGVAIELRHQRRQLNPICGWRIFEYMVAGSFDRCDPAVIGGSGTSTSSSCRPARGEELENRHRDKSRPIPAPAERAAASHTASMPAGPCRL